MKECKGKILAKQFSNNTETDYCSNNLVRHNNGKRKQNMSNWNNQNRNTGTNILGHNYSMRFEKPDCRNPHRLSTGLSAAAWADSSWKRRVAESAAGE